jgi:hypothetical protein
VRTAYFEPIPESASGTRDFLRSFLHDVVDTDLDLVLLLATELVTNAIVHSRQAFQITVSLAESGVLVSVADLSPVFPSVNRAACHLETGGRGLAMVEIAAKRWGVEATEAGKKIWFEVARGANR